MTSVSAGHIILTPTQPVGSGWPQRESNPVSQDISEPDEWEPFRFILALVAGFFGTIPINPDPSGRIFGNHQDISEPTIRTSALMNF